jgi:hypothetical protein
MGFAERLAALLPSLDESYHVEEVDVRQDPPTGGRRVAVEARYVAVREIPSGVKVKLRFGTNVNTAFPVRSGDVFPVNDASGRRARAVFVEWTKDENASAEGRYEVKLAFSDDRLLLLAAQRIEVVEAPATGGRSGQKVIAVPGTAEALADAYAETEAVMVSAAPGNSTGVTLGFSNAIGNEVDGTGTGDVLWPGQSKTFALDSASRLYMNAQSASDMVSWVALTSRR